jgi:hypothetical protein
MAVFRLRECLREMKGKIVQISYAHASRTIFQRDLRKIRSRRPRALIGIDRRDERQSIFRRASDFHHSVICAIVTEMDEIDATVGLRFVGIRG